MFSFKKKDKDKVHETKDERREKRKKEKEKDKHKVERKQHGELGNIIAGHSFDVDDQKKGRFSFRKTDKRRYDIDQDYENVSPSSEHIDFYGRKGRSGSTDTTGSSSGSAYFGSNTGVVSTNNAPQTGHRPVDDGKRYENEVSNGDKPVPKPRVKRKKSSSIEIKLQSPKHTTPNEEKHVRSPVEVNGTSPVNSRARGDFVSSDKQEIGGDVPPKPPRILADRAGVVEFEVKLINVGSEKDNNRSQAYSKSLMETDGPVKPVNAGQSFAEAPTDFGGPKIILPPRDASNSPSSILSPSEKSLEEMGVDLKLPEVQPATSAVARVIKLKRRSSGDFGFALRRANAPGSGKTVHFVEPVGADGVPGLLPGDRLLEVNGVNVENEPREKIIEMIVMSGDEVVIKVIPVPELSELSVRSGLDGSTVQLDESNLKAGTLARSGSKRMKKKVSFLRGVNL